MPYRRMAASVAIAWQEVAASLLGVACGSPEAIRLRQELVALESDYQHLIEDAIAARADLPQPLPRRLSNDRVTPADRSV